MARHLLAKLGDVAPDSGKLVRVGDVELALWNAGGVHYATEPYCTHACVSLIDGYVEDGCVECPLHSGRFDLATGKAQGAPVFVDIKIYPVTIEGDSVLVDLAD